MSLPLKMTIEQINSMDNVWLAVPSPDSKRILVSPMDTNKGVSLYTADGLEEVTEVDIQGNHLCFAPNSERFAFKRDNAIYIYDMLLDEIIMVIHTSRKDSDGHEMCFSSDSSKLINLHYTGKMLSYISVYNVETGEEENRFFENERSVFDTIWYSGLAKQYMITGYRKLNMSGKNEYIRFWFDLDGRFDIFYRNNKHIPFINPESCFVYGDKDTFLSAAEAEKIRKELLSLLPVKRFTSFYVFDNLSKLLIVSDGKLSIYAIA